MVISGTALEDTIDVEERFRVLGFLIEEDEIFRRE
jgi:hypothetical protein